MSNRQILYRYYSDPNRAAAIGHDHYMAVTRTQARTETTHLGHVTLYRDELEQIIHAAAEIGEPTIEGPDFVATSHLDLADPVVPERLGHLIITASRGDQEIEVSLKRNRAAVRLANPDALLHSVASRITAVCRPCASWLRFPLNSALGGAFFGAAAMTALVIVGLILEGGKPGGSPVWFRWLLLLVVIATVPTTLLGRRRYPSSGRLINAYRADRPSFWRRNRDQIWITAASLVLGGVVGYVVNELTG